MNVAMWSGRRRHKSRATGKCVGGAQWTKEIHRGWDERSHMLLEVVVNVAMRSGSRKHK